LLSRHAEISDEGRDSFFCKKGGRKKEGKFPVFREGKARASFRFSEEEKKKKGEGGKKLL